jgi:hypothetical protein
MIQGAVDLLSQDGIVGWLFGTELSRPTVVRAFLGERPVGETIANIYRPDLEQVGLGDGCCGFDIRFERRLEPEEIPFVAVRPGDHVLNLPINQRAPYLDLVKAVFAETAGGGRQRSVLGGLWTDRMDAAHMLVGRVAVGSVAAELQPVLQELIASGLVGLPGALAPAGLSASDIDSAALCAATRRAAGEAGVKRALGALGALLFREQLVKLMRAVLDDHPVIYRLDVLRESTSFGQAALFEPMASPGECLLLYAGPAVRTARMDVIRASHELPEFTAGGKSRFTPAGAEGAGGLALEAGLSVDSQELSAADVTVVSAGLIHRLLVERDAPILRAIVAPRRVTPRRFLTGDTPWTEVSHISGARFRV